MLMKVVSVGTVLLTSWVKGVNKSCDYNIDENWDKVIDEIWDNISNENRDNVSNENRDNVMMRKVTTP